MTAAIVALVAQGPALTARLLAVLEGRARGGGGRRMRAPPALAAGLRGDGARRWRCRWRRRACVALGAGLLQTRGLLAFGALRPDLARLSPAAGLGRAFGGAGGAAGRQGTAQGDAGGGAGLAHGAAAAGAGWRRWRGAGPARLARALGRWFRRSSPGGWRWWRWRSGVADYLLVRRRHLARLRMTREEVKREHKESEGDPSHRAERQRLHRELLEQRMVAEVRKADFVVVNPDHIAVALRYDRDGEAAPVVVARGERLLAERIKQVAREAGVPIFRDVTLARSLRDLAEGTEIPEALYEAVAEILRAVYAMDPPPTAAHAARCRPRRRPAPRATDRWRGMEAGLALLQWRPEQ